MRKKEADEPDSDSPRLSSRKVPGSPRSAKKLREVKAKGKNKSSSKSKSKSKSASKSSSNSKSTGKAGRLQNAASGGALAHLQPRWVLVP